VICEHKDLQLVAPSLAAAEKMVSFLRLFKAIQAHNGVGIAPQRPTGEHRKKAGTPACGDIPWTELPSDYVSLAESTDFTIPISAVQMALQLQGIVKLRRKHKFKVKTLCFLRAAEETGTTYLGEDDPDDLEPILDMLYPQQRRDPKHIGWGNMLTDFHQNVRSGAVKPLIPANSDNQAFIEIGFYRPPDSKHKLTDVDSLNCLDDSINQQILNVLSGPEGFAKKNVLQIMESLDTRAKANKLIGQDTLDYLAQLRKQAADQSAENKKARQKRQQLDDEGDDEEENDDGNTAKPPPKKKAKNQQRDGKRKKPAAAKATFSEAEESDNLDAQSIPPPKPTPVLGVPVKQRKGAASAGKTELKQPKLSDVLDKQPLPLPRKVHVMPSSSEDEDEESVLSKFRERLAKKPAAAKQKELDTAKAVDAAKAANAAKKAANAAKKAADDVKARKKEPPKEAEPPAGAAIPDQARILKEFKLLTGFTRQLYNKQSKDRLVTTRPGDRQAPAPPLLRELCGSVRRWGYGTGDSTQTWLVVVGAACPATETLPPRMCVHWLKQVEGAVFVVDIGYHGFYVDKLELVKEHHHEGASKSLGNLFYVPDWDV
jgi:hypothetical protein